MQSNLEVIRDALEEISVSGHKNIELMKLCMDALDSEIARERMKLCMDALDGEIKR